MLYPNLEKVLTALQIDCIVLDIDTLRTELVNLDLEQDPNTATKQDCMEIADASGII